MAAGRDRDSRVLDLAGRVYDAALDRKLWAELAPKIARVFGAMSLGLAVQAGDVAEWVSRTGNFDDKAAASYGSYYHQHDVWAQRAVQLGMSKVFASKDLIRDGEFERTEYYNDWCRRVGVFYAIGAVVPVGAGGVGIIGMHRPRTAGAFDDNDKALVARFLPHLQRALQIRQRLGEAGTEQRAALDALERSAMAVLVLTASGNILHANREAEGLLRAGDGLRTIGGRVAAGDRLAGERLAELVRQAADTAAGQGRGAGGTIAIPRPDRLPLTVLAAPLRPARDGFGPPAPAAILFIRDPEAPTPTSLALRGLFGLTPSEAKIVDRLAEGKSLEEIAAAAGISPHTARTQLKSAFVKTGTSRQAQLVALVLRSVAVLAKP